MEGRALLDELTDFAVEVGLDVRIAPFARRGRSAGGLCLLRGRQVILLDGGAPVVEQTSTLAEALTEALGPTASALTASASVKQALDSAARRQEWRGAASSGGRTSPLQRRVSVLRRPKPGLRAVRPKS